MPRLPAEIGAHRVLADGASAALLRRDGEIDWWCAPRFDSDPILWSLLDPSGACARWTGVGLAELDETPAAPSLRTVLRGQNGRIESVDGFLDEALVRLVRGLDGDLDLTHELGGGGFGQEEPRWLAGVLSLPQGSLRVRSDGAVCTTDGGRLLHRVQAPQGEWRAVVIGLDALPADGVETLHRRLGEARATADSGIAAAAVFGSHPERARDALRVLEACAAPSGAVVAALTTSLPEAVPGERQWDYRYCWLRDAALATSVASLLGASTTADAFLRFCVQLLGTEPLSTPPVVDPDGGHVDSEAEVGGVAGWGGAQPVRTGNAAGGQVQRDALGLFVEAVAVHAQTGGSVDDELWDVVTRIADGIAEEVVADTIEPSSGIWELREPRRLVSEDVGRWLALDRALQISRSRPMRRPHRQWRAARSLCADRVLAAVRDDGTMPVDYDEPDGATDATALLVPLFGMQVGARGRRLVHGTLARLGSDNAVYRYDPAYCDGPGWDGLAGQEGAFLPVSFMAVSALAAVGLREEARARLDGLCAELPRLLPEMWDPVEARSMGNVPLVWSHMELARALHALDAADRRARYGPVGFRAWRLARSVSLRRRRARDNVRP